MKTVTSWCGIAAVLAGLLLTSGCAAVKWRGKHVHSVESPLIVAEAFKVAIMCPKDEPANKNKPECQIKERY